MLTEHARCRYWCVTGCQELYGLVCIMLCLGTVECRASVIGNGQEDRWRQVTYGGADPWSVKRSQRDDSTPTERYDRWLSVSSMIFLTCTFHCCTFSSDYCYTESKQHYNSWSWVPVVFSMCMNGLLKVVCWKWNGQDSNLQPVESHVQRCSLCAARPLYGSS